ncbi:MAG: hypothetical protein WA238_18395, partial [Methylocella sp.]
AERFNDRAVRAVADQHQGQNQLPQPNLGHGQVVENLLGCDGVGVSTNTNMEDTGILENPVLVRLVLPVFEPVQDSGDNRLSRQVEMIV